MSPVLPGASDGAGDAPSAGEALVRDLAALLATDAPGSQQGGAAAAARLAAAAHDLPSRLSGPLLELLELMREDASCDATVAARQQGLLRAFVQALQAELPRLAPERRGASGSGWAAAPPAGGSVGGAEAAGLLELLGEQDAAGVLAHAAAATSRGGAGDEREGIFSMLSDIHSQGSVQRYLSLEMDPALALDVTDVPGGWRGAELPPEPGAFLDGMRPLLDTYLTAQGERPLHDSEWQVYREAALTEAEGQELEDAAQRRAAGHSPFCNSRADEAYLLQRLRAGISQDSVLYAAAHKYLAAACRNRTWRFAQRRRLVDRLVRPHCSATAVPRAPTHPDSGQHSASTPLLLTHLLCTPQTLVSTPFPPSPPGDPCADCNCWPSGSAPPTHTPWLTLFCTLPARWPASGAPPAAWRQRWQGRVARGAVNGSTDWCTTVNAVSRKQGHTRTNGGL